MTYKTAHEKYGGMFGDLTEDDVRNAGTFLQSASSAEMSAWSEARTEILEINGQPFRMIVDRGADDESAVVVGGEFGNGISPWAVARARVVRDMVAPEATLIYQPNTTFDQPNMNFSNDERRTLSKGNTLPLLGRLAVVLGESGNPEDLTFYGPSQGGVTSLSYAAGMEMPAAVAVVETPT